MGYSNNCFACKKLDDFKKLPRYTVGYRMATEFEVWVRSWNYRLVRKEDRIRRITLVYWYRPDRIVPDQPRFKAHQERRRLCAEHYPIVVEILENREFLFAWHALTSE